MFKRRSTSFSITILLVCFMLLALFYAVALAQPAMDEEDLELGARVYAENCAVCHGKDGNGRVGASLTKDWPSIRPDLLVRSTIENGVPGSVMPAWGQQFGGPLTEAQMDALMSFILSWQTGEGFILPTIQPPRTLESIDPVPEIEGDPNRGAVLFFENCAVCHGPDGEGRVGATLAKPWSAIRPDLFISNSINKGVPGTVMPAWGQENGGPLNNNDIEDIVSFILSRQDFPSIQSSPTVIAVSPVQMPWLRGIAGVVVFLLLLVVILGAAYYFQRNR